MEKQIDMDENEALTEFLHSTTEGLEAQQDARRKDRTQFKLIGLSAPMSFTLRTVERQDTFWAESRIPDDRYRALREWAKSDDDFWKQNWQAIIAHDGFFQDGTPCIPVVI